jgi:hypothetical protein
VVRLYNNPIFKILSGLAIVGVFFFGTLFLLDQIDRRRSPEAVRAEGVKSIKAALEYRSARNAYPDLPNGPITQLADPLVGGGYLVAIPNELQGSSNRYLSDGKSYGLRIARQSGGDCIVEVGATKTGWWGLTLPCSF